jgi:hypothetical protein
MSEKRERNEGGTREEAEVEGGRKEEGRREEEDSTRSINALPDDTSSPFSQFVGKFNFFGRNYK